MVGTVFFFQVFQLESTFDIKRYLSSSERAGLAASLQLSETQVGIDNIENKLALKHKYNCFQPTKW